ncbi:hypothetical protein JK361_26575 [Streptomyces sp. 5-8]|uniref:Integral membrane protein n=1 Tax=Streptomyces musisoli TaxID=2802280 RepID=A0ABS1P7G1_9ACTN|nr:hypothetical protein [Streptomyces musisoli]MBL1108114.1 hypothetical protein [Streptomyces musisoli]
MLALRLTRAGRPAVQLRRLLVAAASAGTGFLLLACLGHALNHPDAARAAALRLAWCAAPLAATVYLALAVARTDPGTRPRAGLSAVGLGPARLMAVSALTTALSCALGSMLALMVFLHLRGDLTGMPFDGAAADFLAADRPLPVPATLTLLALLPATATATVAVALRPRDPRPAPRGSRGFGRFGAYGNVPAKETFGAYGRFGARFGLRTTGSTGEGAGSTSEGAGSTSEGAGSTGEEDRPGRRPAGGPGTTADDPHAAGSRATGTSDDAHPAGGRATGTADDPRLTGGRASGTARAGMGSDRTTPGGTRGPEPAAPGAAPAEAGSDDAPAGLPWGVALVTAGLAVQSYAGRSTPAPAPAVLLGWLLTGTGLVLAAPGLTRLCGLLLQSTRPGALRLLAGRVLMTEAVRIGRPLGVVCAVASAGYATTVLHDGPDRAIGPLSALGVLVVAGSTVATLLTAAVEARQCRADTTAALLRLGAPAAMLRGAAALRAAALLSLFGPLTLVIAALSALPLAR